MPHKPIMLDYEFVRMVPRKVFVPTGGQLRFRPDKLFMDKAADMQRRRLVTIKPQEEGHAGGGYFVDVALTELGRETFRGRK